MPATPALMPPDLGFGPWDPAFVADPYPVLARLRAAHPIRYDERTRRWIVSRHEDVLRGLQALHVRL